MVGCFRSLALNCQSAGSCNVLNPFQHVYLQLNSAAMLYVSRKEHFNAAHKLYNPSWTREKNVEVFGPCANENWHGHNFELIVTVRGTPDPETGFVIDLKKLSTLIRNEVIDKLDHKNLNVDVDFMIGKLASCENLVLEIWRILEDQLPSITSQGRLHCIRLYETPRNYVEYYGEQDNNSKP
jgi:6-pyruvoyltetrahydropterin/6-carboxytetrahydropterin synthase